MPGLFFLGSFMRFMKAVWIVKCHINYSQERVKPFLICVDWGRMRPEGHFTASEYEAHFSQEPGSHQTGQLAPLWAWATPDPSWGTERESGSMCGLFNVSSCRGSCRISGLIWSVWKELLQSHFQGGNLLLCYVNMAIQFSPAWGSSMETL